MCLETDLEPEICCESDPFSNQVISDPSRLGIERVLNPWPQARLGLEQGSSDEAINLKLAEIF